MKLDIEVKGVGADEGLSIGWNIASVLRGALPDQPASELEVCEVRCRRLPSMWPPWHVSMAFVSPVDRSRHAALDLPPRRGPARRNPGA